MVVPHVFDVANQMSQAELQSHVFVELHVLAIGAKVVAPQKPVKLRAQDVHQHFAAARRRHFEHGVAQSLKAPSPSLAVVLVPGLVHVQDVFLAELLQHRFIRVFQAFADLADHLGDEPLADTQVNHIAEEAANSGNRHVANAMKPANERRETRADQSRLQQMIGKARLILLFAVRTPLADDLMLCDEDRLGVQLDLLKSPHRIAR